VIQHLAQFKKVCADNLLLNHHFGLIRFLNAQVKGAHLSKYILEQYAPKSKQPKAVGKGLRPKI